MPRPELGGDGQWDEHLTARERRAWREAARPCRYARGEALLRQGEPGRHVLLVDQGLAKVVATSEGGGEVVLAIRGPGETLGEMAVLDGGGRSARATALTELRAWLLGTEAFLAFLRRFPRVPVALLLTMSARLRDADAWRLAYGTRSATQRMVTRLLELAETYGEPQPDGSVRVGLRVTQADLAASVAASRESVVKAVRRLRDADALDVDGGGRFVLTDHALLHAIVGGDVTHTTPGVE